MLAISVSLLLNADVWRRSAIGLWHAAALIAVWYILRDLLACERLARAALIDALLLTGAIMIAFGMFQLRLWIADVLASGVLSAPPRPVSTLGNANAFAAVLVALMPLIWARRRHAQGAVRAALTIYLLAAALLLLLTTSRGAWIGAAVGVGAAAVLDCPRAALRRRLIWVGVGAVGVSILLLPTLNAVGRSVDTRLWIYDAALRTFAAQPTAGSGAFTFGRDLARHYSTPTYEPHAHAHSLILHVMAELGIAGMIALALTLILSALALLRAHQRAPDREKTLIIGAAGALCGMLTHHLFDVPSMMPAVALIGVVILAAGVSAPERSWGMWRRGALTALLIALVGSGIWSALIYQNFWNTVTRFAPSGDYAAGASELESVIAADPRHPAYIYTQGMLWGLAAWAGDADAAERGAAAFERFTALEPDYSMGWVNLAALRAQMGDVSGALSAWKAASDRALTAWSIHYRWGVYAEAQAEPDLARTAYQRALNATPDIVLLPEWDESSLRRALADGVSLTGAGEAVRLLIAGDAEGAAAIWFASGFRANPPGYAVVHALDGWIALERGDLAEARRLSDLAAASAVSREDSAWAALIAARVRMAEGVDPEAVRTAVIAARTSPPLAADWEAGANIFYTQMLSLATPRLFLPQARVDISYTGALIDAALASWQQG
jgi:tetratricopeptide (TPR) repeat protein/O-antigen ligase